MKCECHGHIIADGVSYHDAMARHLSGVDREYVRRALEQVAACGVTFYRDGGDKYMVSAYAKEIAGEYGIDYRTPVWISYKKGHYGSMYGRPFDSPRDFRTLLKEALALGADFVKITVSGMLSFDGHGEVMGAPFLGRELREVVHIAKGEGLAVMAHVNGAPFIKAALEAGVDSVEHGFWPDETVIGHFLDAKAVWVPTSVTVRNQIGKGRFDDALMRRILEDQAQILKKAYEKGVLIASGSDCGANNVFQGSGTLDEIRYLSELGIDPARGNEEIMRRFKRL
mgnify:FL=1